jgi:AcrR family transcriptional regulator
MSPENEKKPQAIEVLEKTDASAASLPRRTPAQHRSRERMERILAVASELIEANGSDQMKMSDVADRAGISIGSLYQYFPDKSSIIRKLAERYSAQSRVCIEDAFRSVTTITELEAAYVDLMDLYYSIFLAEPVMRDIWSGMQTDKHLMALELAESRVCGAMLADAMCRAHNMSHSEKTSATAFLIWQLGESAVRLAISVDRKEGDHIIGAFKAMTLREILRS